MNIIVSKTHINVFFNSSGTLLLKTKDDIYEFDMVNKKPSLLNLNDEIKKEYLDLLKKNQKVKKGSLVRFFGSKRLQGKINKEETEKMVEELENVEEEQEAELIEEARLYYENEEYDIEYEEAPEIDGVWGNEDKLNYGGHFVFAGDDTIKVVNNNETYLDDTPVNATYETYLHKDNHVIFMTQLKNDLPHYRISLNQYGVLESRLIGENPKKFYLKVKEGELSFE